MSDVDGIITHHQQIGVRLNINARFSTTLDNGGASQILGVATRQGNARMSPDMDLVTVRLSVPLR